MLRSKPSGLWGFAERVAPWRYFFRCKQTLLSLENKSDKPWGLGQSPSEAVRLRPSSLCVYASSRRLEQQ